ncbi:hypothetical protein [Plantactinospora sp. GCM10030261]|uniref:hypothetical protein n=1 Tax=Plantactinospora sp. GCM10030261 TaxID=3273420 RepID=UPI0036237F3B
MTEGPKQSPQSTAPTAPTAGPPYPPHPAPPGVPTDPPSPPAARASLRRRWLILGLAALLLLCATPIGLTVAFADRLTGRAAGTSDDQPAPSPRPGDPPAATAAWLRDRLPELLDRQSAALLRGDQAGFLSIADPEGPAAGTLKRQYGALRALGVAVWRAEVGEDPTPVPDSPRQWRLLVTYQHCFAVPNCAPSPVPMLTRWLDNSPEPRLVAVEPVVAGAKGPRPWQVSDLIAVSGERTLVATTPALRGRLPDLLARAERAALVADRYAVDGTPPDRYRIFYAGKDEWDRWYGGQLPTWTAGYALAIGGGYHEVVLNAAELADQRSDVDALLRHEMSHAASLPDRDRVGTESWWLIEGVAEHAAANGRAPSRYPGLPDVRRLVGPDWDGRLGDLEPTDDAADWQVSGSYGIGYLAVRHLVDRFGERSVLDFFAAVVHRGRSLDDAARQVFGGAWAPIEADCVAYLRGMAG